MKAERERRLLQTATALACFVPITVGAMGVAESASMLRGVDSPLPVDLDSHYRYLSGLLLGTGLLFAAAIPRIETRGPVIRTLGTIVVLGGLARLVSLADMGVPGRGHQIGLVMELIVVPLILVWQARVARLFQGG